MKDINTCPHCGGPRLPDREQPAAGTHAFSIKYECGSQVVYLIGEDWHEFEELCPVTNKSPKEGTVTKRNINEIIENVIVLTRNYEAMNDLALGLKLAEEVGELSEVLLKANGHLAHKEVKEDVFHEVADVINVCAGILAQHYDGMEPGEIIDALAEALQTKTDKYASIVTPKIFIPALTNFMDMLTAAVDQLTGAQSVISLHSDGSVTLELDDLAGRNSSSTGYSSVEEMITTLTKDKK